MKKITSALFLFLVFRYFADAQVCYEVVQVAYQPAPFVGTNVISSSPNPMGDDVFSQVIPIGFSFCFFNVNYESLLISTNGYITFDLSNALQYSAWPITTSIPDSSTGNITPHNAIMSPWQDVDPSEGGGTISYELQGMAPYRRFVVSYDELSMYSCNSVLYSNQLILYETTNIIEMNIKEKSLCSTWNDGAAIEGIQNIVGTEAYVVPGRNYPEQWIAYHDSWRFIPACGCAGPAPSNLIAGKIFADYNSDCEFNGDDVGIDNQWILANNGQFYSYSDSNGAYQLWVDTGTYVVNHSILPYFTSKCPPSGNYNFSFATNDSTINADFADTSGVFCSDLSVDIGVVNLTQCYFEYGSIHYCNNGTAEENTATIIITLPDSLQLTSSSVTAVPLGNGQYQFNVGSIGLGECGFIGFTVDVGCDTLGTVLCLEAQISGSVADCDSSNNSATDCHSIISSFDPNGMEVASQNFASEGYVLMDTIIADDDLSYLIHFQNTGNDTAYNIVIRDTISGYLDPATVQPGAASHPYTWLVQNGVIIFQFNNIKLPDSLTNSAGSMGFVKFSIKQEPGNLPGTTIANKAAIFFDYNLPVITNITLNVIPASDETGINDPETIHTAVYPNPFHDQTEVLVASDLLNLQFHIYDVFGRQLLNAPVIDHHVLLKRNGLANGIYFFTINQYGKNLATGKLMVQ